MLVETLSSVIFSQLQPRDIIKIVIDIFLMSIRRLIIMIQNSTRHTLDRAKHHLSEMKKVFQDDEVFSFNLSSFVEAARSITLHMQKQYGMKEGFGKKDGNEWYGSKVAEMSKQPNLRFLIKARNYSEKEGPIPTGATRSSVFSADLILVNEGSKTETPESEITEALTTLEPPEPKTLGRWFWDVSRYLDKGDKVHAPEFEKSDVIETCDSIIEYLDNLVNECEKKFS